MCNQDTADALESRKGLKGEYSKQRGKPSISSISNSGLAAPGVPLADGVNASTLICFSQSRAPGLRSRMGKLSLQVAI